MQDSFIQLCQTDSFKFKDSFVATGHGAMVAGKINPTFEQFRQRNQLQLKKGIMPFSLSKNQTSIRHTLATSVCGMFLAVKSGRKDVPKIEIGLKHLPMLAIQK